MEWSLCLGPVSQCKFQWQVEVEVEEESSSFDGSVIEIIVGLLSSIGLNSIWKRREQMEILLRRMTTTAQKAIRHQSNETEYQLAFGRKVNEKKILFFVHDDLDQCDQQIHSNLHIEKVKQFSPPPTPSAFISHQMTSHQPVLTSMVMVEKDPSAREMSERWNRGELNERCSSPFVLFKGESWEISKWREKNRRRRMSSVAQSKHKSAPPPTWRRSNECPSIDRRESIGARSGTGGPKAAGRAAPLRCPWNENRHQSVFCAEQPRSSLRTGAIWSSYCRCSIHVNSIIHSVFRLFRTDLPCWRSVECLQVQRNGEEYSWSSFNQCFLDEQWRSVDHSLSLCFVMPRWQWTSMFAPFVDVLHVDWSRTGNNVPSRSSSLDHRSSRGISLRFAHLFNSSVTFRLVKDGTDTLAPSFLSAKWVDADWIFIFFSLFRVEDEQNSKENGQVSWSNGFVNVSEEMDGFLRDVLNFFWRLPDQQISVERRIHSSDHRASSRQIFERCGVLLYWFTSRWKMQLMYQKDNEMDLT